MNPYTNRIINLELSEKDNLKPCPFCGRTWNPYADPDDPDDDHGPELHNTHTAAYWIACPCGAEVHGRSFVGHLQSHKQSLRHHRDAKRSAVAAWNRRDNG